MVMVYVDEWEVLSEIGTDDLRAELAKRGTKDKKRPDETDALIEAIDRDSLSVALWHWRAHRTDDAIYFLEKALGKPFGGLAQIATRVAA